VGRRESYSCKALSRRLRDKDWTVNDGLQEHRFVRAHFHESISSSFYIDPNKELRKVFICGVSFTLKVSLFLSELTTRIDMEISE
jgi:hypothetical protein